MTRTLRVYRSEPKGAVLALTIKLAKNGKVSFSDGKDAEAATFVRDLVGKGVPSPIEPRVVEPSEGEAYVEAVASMLASSSRWLVVEE